MRLVDATEGPPRVTDQLFGLELQSMAGRIGAMTLEEVKTILEAEVVTGDNLEEIAVAMGFGAGMGLTNIQKSSDTFEIQSATGKGTLLTASFFTDEQDHETG